MYRKTLLALAVAATAGFGIQLNSYAVTYSSDTELTDSEYRLTGPISSDNRFAVHVKNNASVRLTAPEVSVTSETQQFADLNGAILAEGSVFASTASELLLTASGRENVVGIAAVGAGSKVTVGGENLVINTSSERSNYGIYVEGASSNSATVNINAKETLINAVSSSEQGGCLAAVNGGILNVDGNLYVTANNVITVRDDSSVFLNTSGTHSMILNGNIRYEVDASGNPAANQSPTVNIVLNGNESFWNGNAYMAWEGDVKPEAPKGPHITLMNGAVWNPHKVIGQNTEVISVGYLSMNGGVLNLYPDMDLKIGNIGGTGTLCLSVIPGESVQATTVGNIDFDDYDANADPLLYVRFNGINSDNYTIEDADDLVNIAVNGNNPNLNIILDEGFYNDRFELINGDRVVRTENTKMNDSVVTHAASTGMTARLLTNDIRKRLGEIRFVDKNTDGAWVRYDGGRMSSTGVSNKFNTLQIGYDTALTNHIRTGIAASYTRSDAEVRRGAADIDTYSLALYGAWTGDNGLFADVVARVASVKNEMTLDSVKGNLDNTVYALSGEFGQRFNIAEAFFVEPQIELTYTYVDSSDMDLNHQATYRYDSINSLIGRVGIAAGWTSPSDKSQLYVRESVLREFNGDSTVRGGDRSVVYDGADTWAELGFGAQYNISKNAYIWADVERTQGADINEDFRGTLGVRVSF